MAIGIRRLPALLGAGWLVLGACRSPAHSDASGVRGEAIEASSAIYLVELSRTQRDYWLRAPHPGAYVIHSHSGAPIDKSKLVFDVPLAPGHYRLALSDAGGCGEQTIVLSVPLSAGHYDFEISADGCARYDLAFHDARPTKEYRYTLRTPRAARSLHLEIPHSS